MVDWMSGAYILYMFDLGPCDYIAYLRKKRKGREEEGRKREGEREGGKEKRGREEERRRKRRRKREERKEKEREEGRKGREDGRGKASFPFFRSDLLSKKAHCFLGYNGP